MPDISVVVPVYNEEPNIGPLYARIVQTLRPLELTFEVIFVNDGSDDNTIGRLRELAAAEPEVHVIDLSRRFGKEAGLTCGIARARGKAVVLIDGDLQHPPELLADFVRLWREGYEMVFGVRRHRGDQGVTSRFLAHAFYWTFAQISQIQLPPNAGDFRLMDRKVVDALNRLPERNRFMKGLYAWVGFRCIGVPYTVELRRSGGSKWTRFYQLRFAFDAITAFSNLPLRILAFVGGSISMIAFLYIAFRIIRVLYHGIDVPGYESILACVLFLGGVQLMTLGIIGDYLGRVFEETKRRPLYVIRETFGGDGSLPPAEELPQP